MPKDHDLEDFKQQLAEAGVPHPERWRRVTPRELFVRRMADTRSAVVGLVAAAFVMVLTNTDPMVVVAYLTGGVVALVTWALTSKGYIP